MNTRDFRSMEITRLLEKTAARAFKMQLDEIVPAFDEAEAICLRLAPSEELELEVKRRVAEWKMRLLCDRDAPFEPVNSLHSNIIELGFSNLEIEGSTEIYFAQYCERQGRFGESRQILQKLRAKLDDALKTQDLEVYRHFKEVSDEILSRVDQN